MAIVESSIKFSLSLPTYVLLNREKLAAKDEASPLNHELVHQWFGCAVSPDMAQGNWCEGLADFFSEYLQAEQKNAAWSYRRQLLAACQKQQPQIRDFALSDFTVGVGPPSRAVGYGQAVMVFSMLRRQVGEPAFAAAIRQFFAANRFTVASWTDLQKSFEKTTGRDLSWFFRQWVHEPGQPQIMVNKIAANHKNGEYLVNLVLRQEGQPKRLLLPVTFQGPTGASPFQVELDRGEKSFSFHLAAKPEAVVIDKDYTVFRTLTPAEYSAARAPSSSSDVPPDSDHSTRGIRHPVNFSAK
jgi:aminopeptidase N